MSVGLILVALSAVAHALLHADTAIAAARSSCDALALDLAHDECVEVVFDDGAGTCQGMLDSECLFARASQELGDLLCAKRIDARACQIAARYSAETGECVFQFDHMCEIERQVEDVVERAKTLFGRFQMK